MNKHSRVLVTEISIHTLRIFRTMVLDSVMYVDTSKK